MLAEAMIRINPKDRGNLSIYIRALKSLTTNLLKNGPVPYPQFLQELNTFSTKRDKTIAKRLSIRYEYVISRQKGQYVQESETININITHFIKVRSTVGGTEIVSIDINEMIPTFFHEFTHYKQDMKIRSKHFGRYLQALGHKDFKSYFRDPMEQQAWAIQYLEFLRAKMKITKPEEILSQLRKMGMLHDKDLNALKSSDYDSWKDIMKNAVMTALHDLEKTKKSAV